MIGKYNIIIVTIIILFIFYKYHIIKKIKFFFNHIFFDCNNSSNYINKIYNSEFFKSDDDFGFIITRHVNSEMTNNYWIECIKCIRKFYNNKIIVIDDNSDIKYLNDNNNTFTNTHFINSEYNGRGEMLPYYYFYNHKYFNKAVIIHDSMFFNKHIDFKNIGSCRYIFHYKYHIHDDDIESIKLIRQLKNSDYLIEKYNSKDDWKLCFGVQSVVTYKFLNILQKKYNFMNLINHIKTRNDRMCLERIYGLLCTLEKKSLNEKPSIFGEIDVYMRWGYKYEEYLRDKNNNNLNKYAVIKVWSGR